jgi:hypothetical protein
MRLLPLGQQGRCKVKSDGGELAEKSEQDFDGTIERGERKRTAAEVS